MDKTNTIFISVTHQLTAQQTRFLKQITSFLKMQDFDSVTVGRNISSVDETIFFVRDSIEATQATLVIAFKKLEIVSATYEVSETSKNPDFSKRILASIWNHIEAAMAVQARKPLLILCEKGIYLEGTFRWKTSSPTLFSVEDSTDNLSESMLHTLTVWISSLEAI